MKLKFVSELIQIASHRFIEALEGSKLTAELKLIVMCNLYSIFSGISILKS